MVMLVTLGEAKEHLRVTHNADDDDIVNKIQGASAAVLAYLKSYDFIGTDGTVDRALMPPQVRQATLKTVDWLFTDRGGEEPGDAYYLPRSVVALLYPLRAPALA